MKIQLKANLAKADNQSPASFWWTRKVAIPIGGIIAVLALTVILTGSIATLILNLKPATISGPQAPPSATFLRTDPVTQGSWREVYGLAGYAIAGDRRKFPSFAHIGLPDGNHSWKWADQVEEVRAMQRSNGTKRIAAAWFSWTPLLIDVNLTDDKTHRLALYLVDWDSNERAEDIQIVDAINQHVLDDRQVSKFSDGQYIIWNISGHIQIRVTPTARANAIVNGLFLD